MRQFYVTFAVTVSLFGSSLLSGAEFPSLPGDDTWENRPNDPGYESQWYFYSHLPKKHRNPNVTDFDREQGAGMWLDKAWQLHTGNANMLLSIHDSGIDWAKKDLVNRIYINQGELPAPEGFANYDVNNDGRFNIQDYAHDSRVGDRNQNGLIDVEDLILSFSDGTDSDGNGYVDDISGWDFAENDNNPGDRTLYLHGTSQGMDSVAEINNGIGNAGACGNCMAMVLRVNDTFIVDSQAYAASMIYAADNGVQVIQSAVGGLNYSEYVRKAANYAFDKDVLIIGTAADEASFHNNQPAMIDPIVYPNAVRYDNYLPVDATTFTNFNNCSNYGPRLDVSVGALYCSSEATANLSGIAALVRSYSKTLNKPLSAGEMVSLLKSTVTDINFGINTDTPSRYSTFEGWDLMTGFGRVNAWNMMQAIRKEVIPPEVRVLKPNWFEIFRQSQHQIIPVHVRIGQPRKGSVDLVISVARGVETSGAKRYKVLEKKGLKLGLDGHVVDIDINNILQLPVAANDHPRYHDAYTILVELSDEKGRKTVTRRTVYVFEDGWLFDSFPFKMRGSGESAGLFVDLDKDGKQEYVTGDGSGQIYALSSAKGMMPGFPVKMPSSQFARHQFTAEAAIIAPVSAADLNNDGNTEIVAVSFEGDISVFTHDGRNLKGFPVRLKPIDLEEANEDQRIVRGILSAPTLADVTGDGVKEIIVTTLDGHLYIFDVTGKVLTGFPMKVAIEGRRAKIVSSPAVADLNDDGAPELIFGSNHRGSDSGHVFVIDGASIKTKPKYLDPFPVRIPIVRDVLLPTIGAGVTASPAVADIDNDGELEIVIHGVMGKMYAVNHRGQIEKFFSARVDQASAVKDSYMVTGIGHPAIGKLELNSPYLNVVGVGVGKKILTSIILGGVRYPYQHMLTAWSTADAKMLPKMPIASDDIMLFTNPTLADLDLDGVDELLYASGGNFAHAHKTDGTQIKGFPHFTGGWAISTLNIGDFDGDGTMDVATSTREGYVFIWRTASRYERRSISWPTYQGNAARTGLYRK